MADYDRFGRGGVTFPLAVDARSLLQKADPFVFYALEFARSVLETHVGVALLGAASGTEVTRVVADAVSVNPIPFLTSGQLKFPLLALYRTRGSLKNRTVSKREDVGAFEILYILPPLTMANAHAIGAVMQAVVTVLDDRFAMGADPGHTPEGAAAGAEVWDLTQSSQVILVDYDHGYIPGRTDLPFYALKIRGTVGDAEQFLDAGFDPFTKIAIDVDVVDGTTLPDVVSTETDPGSTA